MTPAISKVYEVLINIPLRAHASKNKIILDAQFGFHIKRSTTHAINKITTEINAHLHKNEIVGACLIDIEKAFDSVWIDGLLYILLKLKFPIDLIQIIWYMTQNRTFITYDGKITSSVI